MLQYNNNSHENNFSIKCGAISISAWKANSYFYLGIFINIFLMIFFLNETKLNFKILYFWIETEKSIKLVFNKVRHNFVANTYTPFQLFIRQFFIKI
jgi:hypothetical protein